MRGIKSNGMLMAASDASHENVELLLPPEGSIPGERIWFGWEEEKENQLDAATANQVCVGKNTPCTNLKLGMCRYICFTMFLTITGTPSCFI